MTAGNGHGSGSCQFCAAQGHWKSTGRSTQDAIASLKYYTRLMSYADVVVECGLTQGMACLVLQTILTSELVLYRSRSHGMT